MVGPNGLETIDLFRLKVGLNRTHNFHVRRETAKPSKYA